MKKLMKPLNISLDNKSAVPVYEQVKQAIRWSILSGYLEAGDQLPSLRELATMLHINPNTIVKVYFQLEVEGFVSSRAGSGFFVLQGQKKSRSPGAQAVRSALPGIHCQNNRPGFFRTRSD